MPLRYSDFVIQIQDKTESGYPTAVLLSPAGQAETIACFLHADMDAEAWHRSFRGVFEEPSPDRDGSPSEEPPAVQKLSDYGAALFDAFFGGKVGKCFEASRHICLERKEGLRIILRIQPEDLAAAPWELLFDKDRDEYLCLSRHTPVVRYHEVSQPPQSLVVQPPLRILAMAAEPIDLSDLNDDLERSQIDEAVRSLSDHGQIDITWVDGQTRSRLQNNLMTGPWHVFHFIGHGGFDKGKKEGYISLCDDSRQSVRLYASKLANLLSGRGLRFVLLNACKGARASREDMFSSTASTLIRRGVPAVLAMQFLISDAAAIAFSETFYKALAEDLPVDAAVVEARIAVHSASSHPMEWATPVLHMRSPDGVIIDRRRDGKVHPVLWFSGGLLTVALMTTVLWGDLRCVLVSGADSPPVQFFLAVAGLIVSVLAVAWAALSTWLKDRFRHVLFALAGVSMALFAAILVHTLQSPPQCGCSLDEVTELIRREQQAVQSARPGSRNAMNTITKIYTQTGEVEDVAAGTTENAMAFYGRTFATKNFCNINLIQTEVIKQSLTQGVVIAETRTSGSWGNIQNPTNDQGACPKNFFNDLAEWHFTVENGRCKIVRLRFRLQ